MFGDERGKDAILFTTNNKISVGKKEGDNAIMFPDLSVWCMKPFVTLSDTVRWETGDMVDGILSREYACKQTLDKKLVYIDNSWFWQYNDI